MTVKSCFVNAYQAIFFPEFTNRFLKAFVGSLRDSKIIDGEKSIAAGLCVNVTKESGEVIPRVMIEDC